MMPHDSDYRVLVKSGRPVAYRGLAPRHGHDQPSRARARNLAQHRLIQRRAAHSALHNFVTYAPAFRGDTLVRKILRTTARVGCDATSSEL